MNRKHNVGDERGSTPSVSGERDRRSESSVAVAAPAGWRSIESAPVDGTDVLVWCAPWKVGAEARYIEDEGWYLANTHPTDACGPDRIYPTHWQPLAAAPSAPAPAERQSEVAERAVKWMNKAMCWLAMQASDAAAFREEGDEIVAALRGGRTTDSDAASAQRPLRLT